MSLENKVRELEVRIMIMWFYILVLTGLLIYALSNKDTESSMTVGERLAYENYLINRDKDVNIYICGDYDTVEVSDEEYRVWESLGIFDLTAYCPCSICCGPHANGITATGTTATAGRTIAVDPNIIPLGSHVMINGIEYIAEDVGGAIKGNHIDIFYNTHEEALNMSVRTAEVYILKEE